MTNRQFSPANVKERALQIREAWNDVGADMTYGGLTMADLDASIEKCTENGGAIVVGPRSLGEGRFCVVKDPAGAVAALYEV